MQIIYTVLASLLIIGLLFGFAWLFVQAVPSYELVCGNKKAVNVETICKGVIGCNYTYTFDDGSIYVKKEIPARINENGNLCILKRT